MNTEPSQDHGNQKQESRAGDPRPAVVDVEEHDLHGTAEGDEPAGQDQSRSEPSSYERGMLRWTKIGAVATAVLGLGTIVLAIAALRNASLVSSQLGEMENAGKQTDKIVQTMQGQLDQMKAAQRPWISVIDVTARTWPIHQDNRAIFKLTFDLKNVGHSPATVLVRAGVLMPTDPWKAQEEICARPGDGEERKWIVLPNDVFPYNFDPPALEADFGKIKEYTPMVVGCIIYRSALDDKTLYRTPFVTWMSVEDPKSPLPREVFIPIKVDGAPMPADNLRSKNVLITGEPY